MYLSRQPTQADWLPGITQPVDENNYRIDTKLGRPGNFKTKIIKTKVENAKAFYSEVSISNGNDFLSIICIHELTRTKGLI